MAETRGRPNLHHAVLAIAPHRLARTAQLFTDLGFRFDEFDLEDVGLHVLLDWDRGLELVTPTTDDIGNPVRRFLDSHGDGVFTLALRVDDAPVAEQIAHRYGALINFRQHRTGDGWQLDEIEMSLLALPLTLMSTNLP